MPGLRFRVFALSLRVAPGLTRRWREWRFRRTGAGTYAIWFGWGEDGSSFTSVVPPPGVRVLGPFARWPGGSPFVADE